MSEILERALDQLRTDVIQMWSLVIGQMEKSRLAVLESNKSLAKEVRLNEKRVDAYELKIDMDSENILMLKNPLAVDMRFVISVLKINYNLERIGDYANTIAKIAEKYEEPWSEESVRITHIPEMYFVVQSMLQDSLTAFENQDKELAMSLFKLDTKLDKYHNEAGEAIASLIKQDTEKVADYLDAFTVIKKLERAGDHILNIGEELVFLIEAIVIKHNKLNKKK
ncbi:MAG TPA: phosphate signaling complex protein PhoU [Bacteroidales bacterium]|jgi:phosphate transport system protein|nr:phosphate signaling complex protein PhoU [Bacteroidales bacterium]